MRLCTKCGKHVSQEEWARMEFVGVMEDEFEKLELRNHECGTTLAMEVKDDVEQTDRPVLF